jgi:organic radical activating enzyme
MSTPVVEIFSSIQGEGLLVGERQIFLRFPGCNLACAYCDTPAAKVEPRLCRIERSPGAQDFAQMPNPLSVADIAAAVRTLARRQAGLHHSVALTGGEPLLRADFLAELLPALGDLGLRAYLETNGTMAEELASIVQHLDVVCTDIKLPSSTKHPPLWGSHERFLLVLAANEDVARLDFAKCVVTADCTADEIERAARLVAGIDSEMALILQPVTPTAPDVRPPSPQEALGLQAIAKRHLSRVRIIAQMHRLAGYL